MVVNRVAGAGGVAPYKILSCPIRDTHGRVIGLIALFRAADADDFELRDIRILEFISRKAVAVLASQYDPLTGLVNRVIFERRLQSLLDAGAEGHTLLYADPPPPMIYARAMTRLGRPVTPEEVAPAFADTWAAMVARSRTVC